VLAILCVVGAGCATHDASDPAVAWPQIAADTGLTFNNVAAEVVAQETGMPDLQNRTEPSPAPEVVKLQQQLMAVINDPANEKILRIPNVVRTTPALSEYHVPGTAPTPVIAIIVDYEDQIDAVQRLVPPTLGGFPTEVQADHIDINGSTVFKNRKK